MSCAGVHLPLEWLAEEDVPDTLPGDVGEDLARALAAALVEQYERDIVGSRGRTNDSGLRVVGGTHR